MTSEIGILLCALLGFVWFLNRKLRAIWAELYLIRMLQLLKLGKISYEDWQNCRDEALELPQWLRRLRE